MKILLCEPDRELRKEIVDQLNKYRLKINIKDIGDEKKIFEEEVSSLNLFSLFVLNLSDPEDTKILNFIRRSGATVPILLILEKDVSPHIFRKIYYLSYDDVIRKDFYPQEIIFHIYKLCDIWNDDVFFISKNVYFDYKNSIFVYNDSDIHLGRKEALLLKFLFVKNSHVVSFDEIIYYVYDNEVIKEERIRSLVRQLRAKLPTSIIQTVKGEGYRIKN
ncbi:MAG: transcriptional regulator [Arcobacter sp.]|nr:MAG: transcriptional regulator [Arcobacter sp.]